MFIKSFKLKSNIQLKGSEKKKLKGRLLMQFPNISELELEHLFKNVKDISTSRVITSTQNNETAIIYTFDKKPQFFEVGSKILPTVYCLWMYPDLVPCYTTHTDVLKKLANGADLMIPGLIRSGSDLKSWGSYQKGDIFGINLSTNKSAIAVGVLAQSSFDLYSSGGRGVAVNVLHVFGDKLWGLEPMLCQQPPVVCPVVAPSMSDFPALGREKESSKEATQTADINEEMTCLKIKGEIENEKSPDERLQEAFLNCLKLQGKKIGLPLLTSTFYPQYVQSALESSFDIKKTSYKKVGTFLKEMSKAEIITIKEETKGVEKIVAINFDHPKIVEFIPQKQDAGGSESAPPAPQLLLTKMTEVYVVTEKTKVLFANFNHELGVKLDTKQIKDHVKDYVCRKKLFDKTTQIVVLDEVLKEASDLGESSSLDTLIRGVVNNMSMVFEMRSQSYSEKGGKKPVIHLTTATRSGNKKVTIITNLDLFGINVPEFAKEIKLAVAASTASTVVPGYKSEQLLIQGNQVQFVHDLLTEKYKIQRNCITGLEFAVKKKKK